MVDRTEVAVLSLMLTGRSSRCGGGQL